MILLLQQWQLWFLLCTVDLQNCSVSFFFPFFRHKQALLEAYDQQCDEATRVFAEYHKRLQVYVNQASDAQRSVNSSSEVVSSLSDREAVYSTVKGMKSADDVILLETTGERNIRTVCDLLASRMVERIRNSFPAYEGNGICSQPEMETTKLGFEYDGDISDEMQTVIVNSLKGPPLLLQAIAAYTLRIKTLISKEMEKIDVRADAEMLRYLLTFLLMPLSVIMHSSFCRVWFTQMNLACYFC